MPTVHPDSQRRHPRPRLRQLASRFAATALLLVGALLSLSSAASAQLPQLPQPSQRPQLPSPMLTGYTVETRGAVRWIYPDSAQDQAEALMAEQPRAWKALGSAFGVALPPELDIRIGIHPEDMRRLAGRKLPSYASGVAIVREGLVLLSLTSPDTWMRPNMHQLLVHELSHVALHRAVDGRSVPRWFTEGVSIHQAGERNISRIRTLWEGTVQRRLIRVEQLSDAFPADHHSVGLAYAQSADLVRYMLDGRDERARFHGLIQDLRGGTRFGDAVQRSYHVSLGFLEREWRSQIQRRYGRWPSVLIGLTGVWALAALLLIAGYIRARVRHRRTLGQWAIEEARRDAATEHALVPAASDSSAGIDSGDGSDRQQVPAKEEAPRNSEPPASQIDRILDRAKRGRDGEPELPTVDHEGHNHTLH